jgi:hypothetical protein
LLRAKFVVEAALEHGVHIAIMGDPYARRLPPSVFTWAPSAPSLENQTACQASFHDAVEQNLRAIVSHYAKGKGAWRPCGKSRPRLAAKYRAAKFSRLAPGTARKIAV